MVDVHTSSQHDSKPLWNRNLLWWSCIGSMVERLFMPMVNPLQVVAGVATAQKISVGMVALVALVVLV